MKQVCLKKKLISSDGSKRRRRDENVVPFRRDGSEEHLAVDCKPCSYIKKNFTDVAAQTREFEKEATQGVLSLLSISRLRKEAQ